MRRFRVHWLVSAIAIAMVGAVSRPTAAGAIRERAISAAHHQRPPQRDAADTDVTLFLIGDAGEPAPSGDQVLIALTREARTTHAAHRVIVFLGDNIYPDGLPDTLDHGRALAIQRIDDQLRVGEGSGARVIFVPGNHDWAPDHHDGWAAIRREGAYIDHASCDSARREDGACTSMLPAGGCPGPDAVDIGARLRLVLLDTQWWLEHGPKPTEQCRAVTPEQVANLLGQAISEAGDRRVVVAAHHPVVSGGVHGEPIRWADPFRSIPPSIARHLIRSDQDFSGGRYQALRKALDSVFVATPPFIFASGHDHGMQVLHGKQPAPEFLVSGAGTYHHLDRVEPIRETRFEAHASGYMRLDFLTDNSVKLAVRVVDGSSVARDAYTQAWP